MDKFYKIALALAAWIRSLPEDKHTHIIANMILASIVAVVARIIDTSIMLAFVGVLTAGVLFEVKQYLKTGSIRLRDSLEDLVANLVGAGSVFVPLLI